MILQIEVFFKTRLDFVLGVDLLNQVALHFVLQIDLFGQFGLELLLPRFLLLHGGKQLLLEVVLHLVLQVDLLGEFGLKLCLRLVNMFHVLRKHFFGQVLHIGGVGVERITQHTGKLVQIAVGIWIEIVFLESRGQRGSQIFGKFGIEADGAAGNRLTFGRCWFGCRRYGVRINTAFADELIEEGRFDAFFPL